jgi:hypothetical protein
MSQSNKKSQVTVATGAPSDMERSDTTMRTTVRATELAAVLSCPPHTDRWLRELAEKGYLVRSGRAEYELVASVQGYIRYLLETKTAQEVSARSAYQAERARKLKLDNDEKENLLLPTELALAAIDYIVGNLRSDLAGVPARVSDDVATRLKVERAIDDTLTSMSESFKKASELLAEGRSPFDEDL